MPEETSIGREDRDEVSGLLAELELQIENVNAGLSRVRATIARISYAVGRGASPDALASSVTEAATPQSVDAGTPANGAHGTSGTVELLPEHLVGPQHRPLFGPDPNEPDATPETGFWTSVAEGASWPRADADEPAAPPADAFEPLGEPATAWTEPDAEVADTPAAETASAAFDAATPDPGPANGAPPMEDVAAVTSEAVPPAPIDESAIWPVTPGPAGPAGQAPATPKAEPPPLFSDWPDESMWSPNVEWRPKPDQPAATAGPTAFGHEPPAPAGDAPPKTDVSDIVAQVRAELEAARLESPALGSEAESVGGEDGTYETEAPTETPAGLPASGPTEPALEAGVDVADDDAKRQEVSRALEEIRRELGAGLNAVQEPVDAGQAGIADAPADLAGPVPGTSGSPEVPAAEPAAAEQQPAFRLAAPGSLPDWSGFHLEPSGPPVVVIKDAEGRVELASVYETLNELGCDDGAALLNYTPHSVTIGLAAIAPVPSAASVAEAVEKIFGMTSHVESDGVRITVNIGADPKQRSVGAA